MTAIDAAAFETKLHSSQQVLAQAGDQFERITFANSLGAEDIVLTDLLWRYAPQVDIFTLDTGRLHPETYALLARLENRYQRQIRIQFPRGEAVETLVADQGINGFYHSIENRKSCCFVRKVEPLKRALQGFDAWVTGLRRSQSVTRTSVESIEQDSAFGLFKINPLLDWDGADVWHYIRQHNLPYNALHDQGYPSIGCAPCTRAVAPGEHERSGRWWWEQAETRECGLHRKREVA